MHNDISEILFTEKQLADRVGEIGAAITRDYADAADEGIILISVLRGAAIFMADLARKIELPLEMDYMAISSYGNGAKSSGVVRILKDLSSQIEGRHVIVAEDILDSGLTLTYLLKNLSSRQPASIEVATLLRKKTLAQAKRISMCEPSTRLRDRAAQPPSVESFAVRQDAEPAKSGNSSSKRPTGRPMTVSIAPSTRATRSAPAPCTA